MMLAYSVVEATRLRELRDEVRRFLGEKAAQPPLFNPKAVLRLDIEEGVVLIGSDAHIWPGERRSTALSAFQRMSRELQPAATIIDGDWVDGARISRHARIGWSHQPKLADEIKQAAAEAAEVQGKRRIWALGNHDGRLETYLANHAPEVSGVMGASLRDHFPEWEPCWAVDINGQVMVRHKALSSVPKTNVMRAGRTTVHGHLHAGNVVAFSDYNGTRWNVDCGTLAIPYGPQFGDYTEYAPVDWRSSFAVLTFKDGRLLWPELVFVLDEAERLTCFRGQVYKEKE